MIERHKTAITRYELSKPLKQAIRDMVLTEDKTFFDYGCGKGDDLRELRSLGYHASGWDPYFSQNSEIIEANIVNLGYVLNVIENTDERRDALIKSYTLASDILIISVLLDTPANRAATRQRHGDGFLTSRNTFQKYYTQSEAADYIRNVLGAEPIAADLGIFYVFKNEESRQHYLDHRNRRQIHFARRTSLSLSERYEIHRELLEDFINAIYLLGRIPAEDEYSRAGELKEKIGSHRKAYSLVQQIFPDNLIEQRKTLRYHELITQMALSRFYGRPAQIRYLPLALQRDVKTFFGTYKEAKQQGDDALYSAGKMEIIEKACSNSNVGKLLPDALYIHRDCMEYLHFVLRIFIGCANVLAGELSDSNVIKINRREKKISFLTYPDFDAVAHPALSQSIQVNLVRRSVETYNYSDSNNPPILHRKDLFVDPGYPNKDKFVRLTAAEEEAGLLENATKIGNRLQWEEHLRKMGYFIQGHTLKKL